MATVNDFLSAVNKKFGDSIPLLPLAGFPAIMKTIWSFALRGWKAGDPLKDVDLDISTNDPLNLPIGFGEVAVEKASINFTLPVHS